VGARVSAKWARAPHCAPFLGVPKNGPFFENFSKNAGI